MGAEADAPVVGLLRRLDPLFLLAPVAWIVATFSRPGFLPNPDSYYHVKCAQLLWERGWIDAFPWLPFTTLRDFPNAYVAFHALMAPLHGLAQPETVLRLSGTGFALAFVFSVYAILRRWQVPSAGLWTAVMTLGTPLVTLYLGTLKGGALFFVLFPWFLHCLWRESARGVFLVTLLAAYAYVGTILLPGLSVLFVVFAGRWREREGWALVAAAGFAFALGSVMRPEPWSFVQHMGRELLSSYARPSDLVAGAQLGSEWATLPAAEWLRLALAPIVVWAAFAALQLRRGGMTMRDLGIAAVCFALLGYSALSGSKLLHLFGVASMLALPILVHRYRPFPGIATAALALGLLGFAGWNAWHTYTDEVPLDPPAAYASLAATIAEHSEPDEVVVAPWGAFPALFFYNDRNRYVAGMNLLFLLDGSPERFEAYRRLYAGRSPNPDRLVANAFDGARLVLVRLHMPGAGRLAAQLEAHAAFDELGTGRRGWRLFRRRG